MKWSQALALGLVAALPVGTARAADGPVHVQATMDYAVPDGANACPDRDTFASAVATRLGYDPFEGANAPNRKPLVVRYRREGSAIIAQLRFDGAEKTIASERGACDEAASTAALAAAILIDPRAMFPRPPPANPPPATGPSLDSRSPGTWPWYEAPPLPPPPAAPKPSSPTLFQFGVAGVGCVGCAPTANGGGTIFFGVARNRFGVDVGARADLPSTVEDTAGRSVSSSLVVGELYPHARIGPLRLGILGAGGALFGSSAGVGQTSPWFAVGARGAVVWAFAAPFFMRFSVDGSMILGRVSLRVDERELWSSGSFAGTASLGAGLEF